MGPSHRKGIRQHLLALDARDRYLRFGYAAG
ncbi:MAG: GNAT family N-acetyltransferase, partial [Burkholderiaceae bacterium]|nr:GNAT family N-acetyltransferase [Burkholderiaceae bacterium]